MNRAISLVLLMFPVFAGPVSGQTPISLSECRQAARENISGAKQFLLSETAEKARQEFLRKMVRPNVWGYGIASYQSDVPNPASALEYAVDFDPISREQFKTGLFYTQKIYDAGEYKYKKEDLHADTRLQQLRIEETLSQLENTVDDIYLNILTAQKGTEILDRQQEILDRRRKDSEALFKEGKIFKKDLMTLEAAILELEAQKESLRADALKGRNMLSELTGKTIREEDSLLMPVTENYRQEFSDPALSMLDIHSEKITLARSLSKSEALPKVSLFGTAGYGKTGLDFFANGSDWYAVAGVFLTVPLTAWRDHKHENSVFSVESEQVALQRSNLIKKRQFLESEQEGEILKYAGIEKQDLLIIEKWTQIRQQSEMLMKEGEASLSDYLAALHSETNAKLTKEIHTLEKIKALLRRNQILVNAQN